jgi:succinyl-CoA synthetase beta subunit
VARLYEFQSKKLLEDAGIRIPEGGIAASPDEAYQIAEKIGKPVVLKIQVWVTGRAGIGGIQFADTPDEAKQKALQMLGMKVKNFVVDKVLVEEKLTIKTEYFVGLVIDDARKSPVLIFSSVGGTGIEEIAHRHPESVSQIPVDVVTGLRDYEARNLVQKTGISGKLLISLPSVLVKLYEVAHKYDARSAEINPLVLTQDNLLYAADCHLTVDDYAVFRHPELGIDVAREFDRPPMPLEKIAYHVEEKDHRGRVEQGIQTCQLLRHQRQSFSQQGLSGSQNHSIPTQHKRLFCLRIWCSQSGTVSLSKRFGESVS